jgi:HSP20 family protein
MTLLARWEPFRELSTMQDGINRMNRLFRKFYSAEGPEEALTTTGFAPPVDIYEDEHNITLKLEVPGIDEKEKDIDVHIESNTLTVHGERNIEKEEKEGTSAVSSGSTEASRARLHFPVRSMQGE